MKLSLAFSTCPNDTFIFEGIVNRKVWKDSLTFDVSLADIQELNSLALAGEVDIVKISYALYPLIRSNYQLLSAGSALGQGVGPLVVSRRKIYPDELPFVRVAIPGENTTANFLFSIAYPAARQKKVFLFSDIEEAVLTNEVDVGVVIHESRFTYQQKGLRKVIDLGEFWEGETKLPIPLGGIAVKRSLARDVKIAINELIRGSVTNAWVNPGDTLAYVSRYAQAMSIDVMQKHISLYVNNYTLDIGEIGRKAVLELLTRYNKAVNADSVQQYDDIFAV